MAPSRCLALLASVTCALAFSPSSVTVQRTAPRYASLPSINLPKVPLPRALNPLDFSVDRPARRPRVEGQALYRQIGIGPEASFDEVKAQVAILKQQYDKDAKKKIKLEVVEEKIMELRLRQIAAGKGKRDGDILAVDKVEAQEAAIYNAKPPLFAMPKIAILKNVAFRPCTAKYAIAKAKFAWLFAFAGAVVVPHVISSLIGITVLSGMNNFFGRGRPKKKISEDEMMMGGGRSRDIPTYKQFYTIAFVTALHFVAGAGLNFALRPVVLPRLGNLPFASDRLFLVCVAAASTFQTCMWTMYPPKASGGKKKKF